MRPAPRPRIFFSCAMLASVLVLLGSGSASAWDPFISANANVEEGNVAFAAEDFALALSAYDRAAVELPDHPAVQLNRGLALMAAGELDRAREAFLRATVPGANDSIRADAYYNLGLAFYRAGDEFATGEDHQNAQTQFREAADALRRSLRARPGDRNSAWNLELALRRIAEEQEAQEQEEQEQEEQEQEEEQSEEEQEDEEDSGEEEQEGDEESGDEENPDSESEDGNDPNQDPNDGEDSPEEQEGEDPADQSPDPEEGAQEGTEGGDEAREPEEQEEAGGREIPEDVARVLDSLANSEESLAQQRARARARQENRRVTMDW